ncbi:MAG: DNA-binding response regulator [Paenibacillaceae bacterium]|jgi:two-component system response regulator YesN|nr:DNA-binding response regulator [Paenibacillaceae bacterium]
MKRYRCLIVDDEDLIIDRLRLLFREFADRFELVGAAYSGMEAIELAESVRPDIVLTDIVMPHMDGLALIASLKPLLPNAVFIILTAYSDFSYAKQAIGLGVNDYIMKVPLIVADVRSALEKAARMIEEQERQSGELERLSRSRLQNVYRLRSQMFGELLHGVCTSRQLFLMREDLKLGFNLEHYFAFVMEDGDYSSFSALYSEKDQGVLKYAMLNIAEETVRQQELEGMACEIGTNRYLGLVALPASPGSSRHHQLTLTLAQALLSNMNKYLKRRVNISFSRPGSGWDTLRGTCEEAGSKLSASYYEGPGAILHPSYSFRPDPAAEEWLTGLIKELPLLRGDQQTKAELEQTLNELARHARDRGAGPAVVTVQLQRLLQGLHEQALGRLGSAAGKPPALEHLGFKAQLAACREYALACLEQMRNASRPEIRKAKQYIEASLEKRCTLDEIAEHVGLAPTYLSTLFKREEGETLVDYMNRRKIEKAVEFLKAGDYSNLELSEMVGIMNERYFCTLFKQIYGLPPKKFRKKFL